MRNLVKSHIFKTQKLEKCMFVWESINPHSILVHYLCIIKVYIVNVRNRILISTASELWTRMECRIHVPEHTPYKHVHNFCATWSVILPNKIFFLFIFNLKVYNTKLPKTLTTNYCTTLQGRYQEEQDIMTTPWHLT